MRVLEIVQSLEKGGRTVRFLNTVDGLRQKNYDVHIISFCSPANWLVVDNITIIAKKQKVDWALAFKIYRFIIANKIKLVHAHCESSQLYAGIACKLAFIPMVATCHRSELNPYAPSKTNTIIKSCTTRFVSVSHNRQTLLINALNIKPNKCRVIHGGTFIDKKPNIDTIRLAKEQLGLDSTNTILFSAGHLGKIKGHQHTIQALEQLVAEQPNTMLYIAGTGSADEKAQIEATIAHCKLESHVTLLGQISNIKQWILSADIFVQPSIEEAFGLVFIEAGACAKPVIATAVGGIVDIINEETGILVPPSSPSSLSKALNTLIKNKALRDMLGDNAYQRISNLFSLDKMINSYDELFKSLRK